VLHKEAHLQIEVGMLAVSLGHAIFSDEDEGRQKMASTEATVPSRVKLGSHRGISGTKPAFMEPNKNRLK
jgi:hypothetical protein